MKGLKTYYSHPLHSINIPVLLISSEKGSICVISFGFSRDTLSVRISIVASIAIRCMGYRIPYFFLSNQTNAFL